MTEEMSKGRRWQPRAFLGMLVLTTLYVLAFPPQHLYFRPLSPEDVLQLLGPILLLALFIERALEVLISSLRDEGKELRKARLEEARRSEDPQTVAIETAEAASYRAQTQRRAGMAAVGLGILISMSGVRLIESVLGQDFVPDLPSVQRQLFLLVDTVLTGAILGGGAEGIHQVMSLFTDYIGRARDNVSS